MLKFELDIQRFAASATISCNQVGEPNVANNTTTERITFTVTRTSGSTFWSDNKTLTFNCDGQTRTVQFNFPSGSVGASKSASVDFVIPHNADGSKSISFSASIATGTSVGTLNPSGSKTLTTIPRTTTCPNLTGDIESTYTIALNPAVDSFTHSLYVHFGNVQAFVNASGNLQSTEYKFSNKTINFTLPASMYNQFTGKSGSGILTCKTYNGNTKIGESNGTLIATCLESRCRPSISGTVVDNNNTTKTLTGNQNKLIKGYSNALINLTLNASTSSADTNSSISSRSIDGASFSGTSITINNVTKKDFNITVTNSRGFSTTSTVSASGGLINYFAPQLNIDAYRHPDETSSQIRLKYSGSFFNDSFGSQSNSITMKWYWRLATSSSWTLGGTITPTISGNNITEKTIECGSSYPYTNEYRFKVEIVDKLTSSGTKEDTVTKGVPIYSHGENWFQHYTDLFDKNNGLVMGNAEYSTSEKIVGKWIDNKPIYRKVIVGTLGSGTDTTIATISNCGTPIKFIGHIQSDNYYNFFGLYTESQNFISCFVSGTTNKAFRLIYANSYKSKNYIAVLEYTKTTD